jgi:predicted TIM-barrel enzyme
MREFGTLGKRKAVLGMVHLAPLPGTPFYRDGSFAQILDAAVRSACALAEGGADGCLVQTVDRVYAPGEDSDPARTAAMALVVRSVAEATGEDFQVGVQLMRNALKASLAVAKVAGGSYIRAGALCDRDDARTLEMIAAVREALPQVPVILAGYTNHGNAARLLAAADGAFVGTCLERGGWGGPIDAARVRAYMDIVRGLE